MCHIHIEIAAAIDTNVSLAVGILELDRTSR
jgi:hypothetical protein